MAAHGPTGLGARSPWGSGGLVAPAWDASAGAQQSGQVDGWTLASSKAQPFPRGVMGSPGVQRSGCWSGVPDEGASLPGSGGWRAAGSPGDGVWFQSRCGAQGLVTGGARRVTEGQLGTRGSRDARLPLSPLGSAPQYLPTRGPAASPGPLHPTLTPLGSEPLPSLVPVLPLPCRAWGCPGSTVGSWLGEMLRPQQGLACSPALLLAPPPALESPASPLHPVQPLGPAPPHQSRSTQPRPCWSSLPHLHLQVPSSPGASQEVRRGACSSHPFRGRSEAVAANGRLSFLRTS